LLPSLRWVILQIAIPIFVAEYRNLRYERAIAGMKLGEKIRYLREVEGSLRGMGRAINQQELVRLIEARPAAS
jgi:hypothetical protein